MRVLMTVDVRDCHTRALNALNLSAALGFDLGWPEFSCKGGASEIAQLDAEFAVWSVWQRLQETRNALGRQNWSPVEEDGVATDADTRPEIIDLNYGIIEGTGRRHQGC